MAFCRHAVERLFLTNLAHQDNLRELADKVAISQGVEIVDIIFAAFGKRSSLRIFIYKEGGVSVDDCTKFSRQYEALLEAEDALAGPTTLEVSSPGLDKPLKTERDFQRNLGKMIEVRYKPIPTENKERKIVGLLKKIEPSSIQLEVKGEEHLLSIDSVLIAKVYVAI